MVVEVEVEEDVEVVVVVVVVVESLHVGIHCDQPVPQDPGPALDTQMYPVPHWPSFEQPVDVPCFGVIAAQVRAFEPQRVTGQVDGL